MATPDKRAVSMEMLAAAVDKIKKDYATKTEVSDQIEQSAGGIEFATVEDVLALFEDDPIDSETDNPENAE